MYERALEGRILLQKVLAGGNRLPEPRAHSYLQQAAKPQPGQQGSGPPQPLVAMSQGLAGLKRVACETLQQLLVVQDALLANNPVRRVRVCAHVCASVAA